MDGRATAIAAYRQASLAARELDERLRGRREHLARLRQQYEKTEEDLKALQVRRASIARGRPGAAASLTFPPLAPLRAPRAPLRAPQSTGQSIGEVLKQLDEDRFLIKAAYGPRYVVGCRRKLDKSKLKSGTRVTLDVQTLTIMRALPREVDPSVYEMLHEDPGNVTFSSVGGLHEQIRELREVVELPLTSACARPPYLSRGCARSTLTPRPHPPFPRQTPNFLRASASSRQRASCSTDRPGRARRCSRARSRAALTRPSSRSSRQRSCVRRVWHPLLPRARARACSDSPAPATSPPRRLPLR